MAAPGFVPLPGFQAGDYGRDPAPRRATRSSRKSYQELPIGDIEEVDNDAVVTEEPSPAATRSQKRKAEVDSIVAPRKSSRTTGKGGPAAQPKTNATKSTPKKPGKASTTRKRVAAESTTAIASTSVEDEITRATQSTISDFSDGEDVLGAAPPEVSKMGYNENEKALIAAAARLGGKPSEKAARKDSTSPAEPTSAGGDAEDSASVNGIENTGEDDAPDKLDVTLKGPTSWFTKEGTFRTREAILSDTPKEKRPRTPAAPKQVRASAGLPTPPAEQETLAQQATHLEAQIDPELLRISRKLTHREPIASKPVSQGSPRVWADSRQALCETVPYFKMPQSGCHQNDGHVYSFLYDGASRCREYMDTDLIIGGAGGGMEADSTGQLVQKKSHTMDEAQVKAVLNDIEHKNPLVIICGNKSEGAICKMPYRYNVLGWFKPVALWAEKTMGKRNKTWTTIKYRFERLNQSNVAWNAPTPGLEERLSDEERQSIAPLVTQRCHECSVTHPMVYLIGWMCLSADCDQFWKLPSGNEAPYGNLHYNPAFLLSRTAWSVETEPFDVRPPVLHVGSTVGDNLTQINTRGMCCPNCGRCNSRRLFKGWKCESSACAYQNFPNHIPVHIPLLHQPWESTGEGPALARNKHDRSQGVQMSVDFQHGFKVYKYTVPGVNGALIHLVSNTSINKLPNGANDMFDAMQREDLHLERRRFGVEKMSGSKTESPVKLAETVSATQVPQTPALSQDRTLPATADAADGSQSSETKLMQQTPGPASEAKKMQDAEDGDFMTAFSMNYGMPYKFVASGASMPFAGSPWPVRAARADLNWASQTFLDPDGHEDLNEELIFAYMEGQKLEYHDDGEEGLGPRIATLSLGGKAKMHLRMKMKHYVGCSKTGVFVKERPVPGSISGTVDGVQLSSRQTYERRLAAWEELQQLLQLTDRKAYNKRAKEIPLELGLYEKRMKKADDLVTVTLNHGDIVLMEGYEIQQYLEHKVVPEQCLRFALTCRTILPDHLKPEERPSYGEEPDDMDMSALRRMGDSNAGGEPEQDLRLKEN